MGDRIYNYGNGNIVNKSDNVQIVNSTEYQQLLEELKKLKEAYRTEYPEDEAGCEVINEAIVAVRNKTGASIQPLLKKLGKNALKVAMDLSLTFLAKLICEATGLL